MNQLLFERSSGALGPNAFARLQTTRLLRSFGPAPHLRFDGGEKGANVDVTGESPPPARGRDTWAHQAGVNALALERFDGRILISGGSDATIRLWDLEQFGNLTEEHTYQPVAQIARAESQASAPSASSASASSSSSGATHRDGHRFGVTHLSFYPFDAAAFLSSSYDQTLKLWATESARLSGSFDLGAKVYTHAVSPVADHLLVACATQHPAVRLVDLRSGAAVQSLVAAGQAAGGGAVLSAAWSPRHEHVLASGAVDGTVRIWDVRRASGLVGLLDHEDSLGAAGAARGARDAGHAASTVQERGIRAAARAHTGPVNGLAWTDDGAYIVSAGHDRRIRVWDAATGANTLASFGPAVRNGGLGSVTMFASPTGLTPPGRELLFWPNETEILVFDLHEGSIVTRLRGVGAATFGVRLGAAGGGERSARNRVTSLAWRGAGGYGGSTAGGAAMGGGNAAGALYSGHLDGQIRGWMPRLEGRDDEGEAAGEVVAPEEEAQRARKRKAVDDAYRSLMGRQITFR